MTKTIEPLAAFLTELFEEQGYTDAPDPSWLAERITEALHMIAGARVEYLPQVQVKADGGERFWNQIGAPCGSRREAQQALDNLHKHIKNHYWVKDSARILTRLVIDLPEDTE